MSPTAFFACSVRKNGILGCLADTAPSDSADEIDLATGDRLVLYTDGLVEVFNQSHEMLAVEGLAKLVRESATQSLPRMKQTILDGVTTWRSGSLITCATNCFKGFYQQRLFTDRDACAVRRGHPIAGRMFGQEEFLKTKHVAVVGREFKEDPVDRWLRDEGYERNVALSVPHYLQALHVVAQSDLIAVIPERLIRACASVCDLDVIAVPMDVGTFDEYLLHPATSHTDAGCMWFRGVLNEIAKSLGPLNSQQIRKKSNRRPLKKSWRANKRLRKAAT